MIDPSVVLATDPDGNDITTGQLQTWLSDGNKEKLSNFFYDRFYGKYLKPFDFPNPEYKQKYKNGFAIMTSCCLLIETYVSFIEPTFRDTSGKSERCFGIFFLTNPEFISFSTGGQGLTEFKDLTQKLRKVGTPHDFYSNVRCGLLHNGETRNKWKISRSGDLYDDPNKRINAVKFMEEIKGVIKNYQNDLTRSDFISSNIWINFKNRLVDLLSQS